MVEEGQHYELEGMQCMEKYTNPRFYSGDLLFSVTFNMSLIIKKSVSKLSVSFVPTKNLFKIMTRGCYFLSVCTL